MEEQQFFEVNGKKVIFVGCVYNPNITKPPKYTPYEPEFVGVPVEFVDPWTGEHTIIYPSSHPKHYPKGYFGSCFNHRWEYFSKEEKLSCYRFWLEGKRQVEKRLRTDPYQLSKVLEEIERLENLIRELS